ncbi:MAG: hypothetical protein IRY85_15210 [Micromonosporaceae bacterium]|nr:hypothetical protein [Micromonosporaceae bacterium]
MTAPVVTRTRGATVAQQIIDSVRLGDPDHNGCPRLRPARPSQPPAVAPPRGEPFVAVQPTEIPVLDAVLRDGLRRSYGWIGERPT